MERWESPVDRAIREAQERGEFDNLPGAGRPLRNLGNPDVDDPDWWVRGLVRREHLDLTGALPPAVALRKEADTFPESLVELRSEESVRAVLEDFNRRVRLDRLRPAVGNLPPLIARTVDVEDLLRQWRDLQAGRRGRGVVSGPYAPVPVAPEAAPNKGTRRPSWLRRLLRRD